ncbi:MAG: DUF1398 family protein [Bacteroidota bacterium]
MFTIEQIKEAHSKVKSGAGFPLYIQAIKSLGVLAFETWVFDSHTEYFGQNNFTIKSVALYDQLEIAAKSDGEKFCTFLKIHQEGETDYLTFCKHCAETGIEKWFVSLQEMTCTYFDRDGNAVLVEQIPSPSN